MTVNDLSMLGNATQIAERISNLVKNGQGHTACPSRLNKKTYEAYEKERTSK